MLARTSRSEILHKLESRVGYPIAEQNLSPATRQAITSLANIQRHLFVMSEILEGERGRVRSNALLSLGSRLRRDKDMDKHADEIAMLEKEMNNKVLELSAHIAQEDMARQMGQPAPVRDGGADPVELKCPNCGASLPLPTARFVKCEYCGTTLSIQDVSSQIRTFIQKI
jgi:hypothetical protein